MERKEDMYSAVDHQSHSESEMLTTPTASESSSLMQAR